MKSDYDAIFVSPHFDDVVFSCGGLLAKLCQDEKKVLLLTLFSNHGKQSNQRKGEEKKNAARLGYEIQYLNLPDLHERGFWNMLPWQRNRPLRKADQSWMKKLQNWWTLEEKKLKGKHFYFPLGVGEHIDHQLAFELGCFVSTSQKVWFYEDLPYALSPSFLEERLRYLTGKTQRPFPSQKAHLVEETLTRPIYSKIPLRKMKFVLRPLLSFYFNVFNRHLQARHSYHYPFESLTLAIDSVFDLKIEMMGVYESQTSLFFHSSEELKKRMKSYHVSCAPSDGAPGLYERFWRFS